MKRTILFKEQFRDAMVMMMKTCTSRRRCHAFVGDTFDAFGCTFRIKAVDNMILRDVSALLYKQEGCVSSEQFEQLWAKIHPRRGFVWNDKVAVYHFERIK